MKVRLFDFGSILFLGFALIFSSCDKDIDQIDINASDILGPNILYVTTHFTNNIQASDYHISISGPINLDTTVSGTTIGLDGFLDGEYIVRVSKPGYISAAKKMIYEAVEDPNRIKQRYLSFLLNERIQPVEIEHQKGGVIQIPASYSLFLGDIRIIIPPGAIEGNGSTPISITPGLVDAKKQSEVYYAIPDENPITLIMEPYGIIFKEPITIEISTENLGYISGDTHFMTSLEKDPASGELIYPAVTQNRMEIVIDEKVSKAIVEVPYTSIWDWRVFKHSNMHWRYVKQSNTEELSSFRCAVFNSILKANIPAGSITIDHTIRWNEESEATNVYCQKGADQDYQDFPNGNICDFNRIVKYSGCPGLAEYYANLTVRYSVMTTEVVIFRKIPGDPSGGPDLSSIHDISAVFGARPDYSVGIAANHLNNNSDDFQAEFLCWYTNDPYQVTLCPDPIPDPG